MHKAEKDIFKAQILDEIIKVSNIEEGAERLELQRQRIRATSFDSRQGTSWNSQEGSETSDRRFHLVEAILLYAPTVQERNLGRRGAIRALP
jgi:hypothetical protein